MDYEFTLVRIKSTKEPVAFFERIDDIMELIAKIDILTTPAGCEYADCPVSMPIDIYFPMICKDYQNDEGEAFDCISSGTPSDEMSEAISDAFEDPENEWTDFPDGMSFGARSIDNAFPVDKTLPGDPF
jgi:hypothetical protein